MSLLKLTLCTLTTLLISVCGYSQIQNAGFENKQTETTNMITNWGFKPREGFKSSIDKEIRHSGSQSLKLTSQDSKPGVWNPFSQMVPIKADHLKRIAINAYIKCTDVKEEVALWCQIRDENDKMIGFQNFDGQGIKISGTADWKKYSLLLTVAPKAKNLLLGGYLMGTGTVWFDDFEIEDLNKDKTPPSSAVSAYCNEFINIIKQNSLFTDSLNWVEIEANVRELSKGVKTVQEARFLADYLIEKLRSAGDNHSFIQDKVSTEKYTKVNSNPNKPESKLLSANIGYISVPGFSSTNPDVSLQFASNIQNMIRKMDNQTNIKGWIVDLRGNTGGNMYPMIAGLGPLIGEGNLGYFVKTVNKKEQKNNWYYTNGKCGAGKGVTLTVPNPYKIKNKNTKIAVLIGPRTSSSGEMTTISFIGKKTAKLFGASSGGYTTANGSFKISDGSTLLLASSYTADRNGNKFLQKISPDVIVTKGKDGSDADIKAAETWLNDH